MFHDAILGILGHGNSLISVQSSPRSSCLVAGIFLLAPPLHFSGSMIYTGLRRWERPSTSTSQPRTPRPPWQTWH